MIFLTFCVSEIENQQKSSTSHQIQGIQPEIHYVHNQAYQHSLNVVHHHETVSRLWIAVHLGHSSKTVKKL